MAKSIPYSERKFDRKHAAEYNTNYQRDHYDRLSILLPKGYRERIKSICDSKGITMAQLFKELIDDIEL